MSFAANTLPDFFVLGAPKCGTTTFCAELGEHPEIAFSDPKETRAFGMDDLRVDNHSLSLNRARWLAYDYDADFNGSVAQIYREAFARARPGQLRGEGTPTYLASPLACERIAERCPSGRFIVLLRHPTERLLSHYHFEAQRCAVNAPMFGALQHALVDTAAVGHYVEHLRRWFAKFPRERFLILPFEAWSRDRESYDAMVCDFLNIERISFARSGPRANVTGSPLSPALHRLFGHLIQELRSQRFMRRETAAPAPPGATADQMLRLGLRVTRRAQRALMRPGRRAEPISESLRPYLDRYYERQNRGLSELTGFDFASLWSLDV